MPYLPIAGSRYVGYSPIPLTVSPGLLSPDTGSDPTAPAFDPSMAQADTLQSVPPVPPPPPQQPPQQSLSDTAARAQIANPPPLVPLNGQPPAGGSARDTGVKQLLAANGRPQMPPPTPPGAQASAAPMASAGGAAAPVAPAATPDTGTFYPQALARGAAAPAAEPAPPPTGIPVDPQLAALQAESAQLQREHLGVDEQGNQIAPSNAAPKSNWLQRLSSALLALTRFAPYSNQIIHPKWTAQEETYQAKQADIAQQEKMIEQANAAGAAVEQKLGTAAWRRSQELAREAEAEKIYNPHYGMTQIPADYGAKFNLIPDQNGEYWLDKDQIRALTPDLSKIQTSYDNYTKDLADKHHAELLGPGQQPPPGWTPEILSNPHTGQQETWVRPPAFATLSQSHPAVADWLVKNGKMTQDQANQIMDEATRQPYIKAWQDSMAKEASTPTASRELLAIRATGKQTGNPTIDAISPAEAQTSLSRLTASSEQGTWEPAEDSSGKAILYNSKTGEVRAAAGIQKPGTGAKQAQEANKIYGPALDSAERFNVMTQNYLDAVKNHDQQAMLSLLANHLGMTMGLQKGARLNQALINEAQRSVPFLQGMAAKFDNEGYLSGVTLTPPQMAQMVNLGRERYRQDLAKARSQAENEGITSNPKRVPSQSTVQHYLALAGGNKDQAKQLLADDGWSE
jgi:hypothetical protein